MIKGELSQNEDDPKDDETGEEDEDDQEAGDEVPKPSLVTAPKPEYDPETQALVESK